MAKTPSKPNPDEAHLTPSEEVLNKPAPVPKSTETLDNGAIVETF